MVHPAAGSTPRDGLREQVVPRRLPLAAAAVCLCLLAGCPHSEPQTGATNGDLNPAEDTRMPREIQGTDLSRKFDIYVPADVPKSNVCASLWAQHESLVAGASSCTSTLDCLHSLQNLMPCTCASFVTDPSIEGQAGALVEAYFDEYDCMAGATCGACAALELPYCKEGTCTAITPSCELLEGVYQEVSAEARACAETADCAAEIPSSPTCQCPIPANDGVWTGFFELALQYWDQNECPIPYPCDCVEGDPACESGMCVVSSGEPQGSKVCESADDCIPVSGCACGCWSQPPADPGPECPCAAPASCDCQDGACA